MRGVLSATRRWLAQAAKAEAEKQTVVLAQVGLGWPYRLSTRRDPSRRVRSLRWKDPASARWLRHKAGLAGVRVCVCERKAAADWFRCVRTTRR